MSLSTGIDSLDRRLSGGLDPGSLLAIVASPASQSEALLHQLIQERPTTYVTTVRRPDSIQNDIAHISGSGLDVDIEYVGETSSMDNEFMQQLTGRRTSSITAVSDGTPVDRVYDLVPEVDSGSNVIVDSTNALERTGQFEEYQEVLTRLKSQLIETESLGVLHCVSEETSPPLRETSLMIADIVWKLEHVSTKDEIEYQLTVPKNRYGEPILQKMSIMLESDIWIDESRTI
jgi:KaiC/GvpD/RAD55 family RecA-like ATPase